MARLEGALTFRVAEKRFCLEAGEIEEVSRPTRLTRVPGAPEELAGLTAHRGRVTPVVSMRALLGEGGEPGPRSRLIVLARSGLALWVDELLRFARTGETVLRDSEECDLASVNAMLTERFGTSGDPGGSARQPGLALPGTDAQAVVDDRVGFMGLTISGQAYAIALDRVVEVISLPSDVLKLAHTDTAMLGVVNWRDQMLPVVSVASLLGLRPAPAARGSRVLVVRIGGSPVGLVIDAATNVIRAMAGDIRTAPAVLNRSAGEARIESILQTGSGRLRAVLEPERLLSDESVQMLISSTVGPEPASAPIGRAAAEEAFLLFSVGGIQYGLPMGAVEQVTMRPERLARPPHAPGFLSGVMNLRGRPVAVVDPHRIFETGESAGLKGESAHHRRILVVRVDRGLCGFEVDAIGGVRRISADDISPTSRMAESGRRIFDRTAQLRDGALILLVDPEAMLDQAERDVLAQASGSGASKPK